MTRQSSNYLACSLVVLSKFSCISIRISLFSLSTISSIISSISPFSSSFKEFVIPHFLKDWIIVLSKILFHARFTHSQTSLNLARQVSSRGFSSTTICHPQMPLFMKVIFEWLINCYIKRLTNACQPTWNHH